MIKDFDFTDDVLDDFVYFLRSGAKKLSTIRKRYNLNESQIKGFMFLVDSRLKGVWEDFETFNGRTFLMVGIAEWGLYEYDRDFGRCNREDPI